MSYAITALILIVGILSTLLAVKSGKLKRVQASLETEKSRNEILTREIVTINETIEKLKKIQAKPQHTVLPNVNDSVAVAEHFNRLSGHKD